MNVLDLEGTADSSAVPAAPGFAALFNGDKPLETSENENRILAFHLILGRDGQ
jgi:hypothetical protein